MPEERDSGATNARHATACLPRSPPGHSTRPPVLPRVFIRGSLGLLVLAALAFWPNYLSQSPASIDAYTHCHAAAGLLWLSLLFSQPLLILRGNHAAHRALGRCACVLAPLFGLSSILLAHYRFSRMDPATFQREAYTLYLPLSASLLFAVAFWLAIRHRRSVLLHARFMAATALPLVDPVLGRILGLHIVELPAYWQYQVITFGLEMIVLAVLWRTLPPDAPSRNCFFRFASIYGLILLLWFAVPHVPMWTTLADGFRALPLT